MHRILVLATRNAGKAREFSDLLAGMPVELRLLGEFAPELHIVEDGKTFEDNARKKAVEVAQATGEFVLSDDSGLQVDALGGRPGVYSARYAGDHATDQDNNRKLVDELAQVPGPRRSARYRIVLAFADPSGTHGPGVHFEHGRCEGHIQLEPRGQHGFGYDPHFVPAGYTRTMAELSPEEKNRVSHRAQAAAGMRRFLSDYLSARVTRGPAR